MEHAAQNFHTMTEQLKLTKELISLVHFVELNESGWVRKTLGKIVLALLCQSQRDMSRAEVCEAVKNATSHDFSISVISKTIDMLVSSKQAMEHPKGRFRVRETALSEVRKAISETEAEENATKSAFIASLHQSSPDLDGEIVWSKFIELFLLPLTREAGANTLSMLSGTAPLSNRESMQPFLDALPTSCREEVFRSIVQFLNPSSPEIRQFILKHVAASFFVAAVSLDTHTVNALEKKRNTNSSIRLFLDTNTIFSVLGLHESDANDGVEGLLALLGDSKAHVKVKLFTFPETIEEATRVISHAAHSMGAMPYKQPLAQAALRANLTGVHAKYLEAASKSATPISPKDYFSPYITNLGTILRSRGIEIIDRSLLISRQDQDVIDDVLDMQKWEERYVSIDRRKPYEAIFHDVYVWHCIQRQRDLQLSSPLDAKEWFVTLDRRLIAFDSFKGKRNANWVPVCIDPSTFIQYAQFWTPRTEQFEKALFGSLRLPLLFREFDSETEDVSIAIINRLSRIESIGDFSSDEIHSLLLNDAVRTRFRDSPSEEAQILVVRDELLSIHKETVKEAQQLSLALENERAKSTGLAQQIKDTLQTNEKIQSLSVWSEEQKIELDKQTKLAANLQSQLNAQQKKLDRLAELEEFNRKEQEQNKLTASAKKFAIMCLFFPFITVVSIVTLLASLRLSLSLAFGIGFFLGFCVVAVVAKYYSTREKFIQETKWLSRICKALQQGWALALLFFTVTGEALYSNYLSNNQDNLVQKAKSLAAPKATSITPIGKTTTPENPKQ